MKRRKKKNEGAINGVAHCISSDKKDRALLTEKQRGGDKKVYNTTVSIQCVYNHLN